MAKIIPKGAAKKAAPVKKVKTTAYKTAQNSITISGIDFLNALKNSGFIFDSDAKVTIKAKLARGRNYYRSFSDKMYTISKTKNYTISCVKKTMEELECNDNSIEVVENNSDEISLEII